MEESESRLMSPTRYLYVMPLPFHVKLKAPVLVLAFLASEKARIDACPFSFDGRGGMIVGFHGYVGKHISAIGIYVMHKSLALYRNSTFADISQHQLFLTGLPRKAVPWGVFEGKLWDDGVFSNIKQVRVHVKNSVNVICAVQFEYVKKDSTSILSQMHGGACEDDKIEVVILVGRDEYLTGISGFYGPIEGYNGLKGITSVAFYSNKKMYGPYGKEGGEGCVYFTSTASPGKLLVSMVGKVTF
ncbi:hypothetical protein L2E82_07455 [Cichorium intybus]|uniref:Uncharacterized protein n=1 Tax=Cichorium intybus TaxID=13427 RepID=A0ACB9G5B1_CICIN|nr:hypothetical protein L2E82_07455 [Cichorium intybus]